MVRSMIIVFMYNNKSEHVNSYSTVYLTLIILTKKNILISV